MLKKKQVVMLPTNKASKIGRRNSVDNFLYYFEPEVVRGEAQHLYILSDEEIKEGDWVIDIVRNILLQVQPSKGKSISAILGKSDYVDIEQANNGYSASKGKIFRKVIASTDKSLKIGSEFSHYSQDLMKVAVYKDKFIPQIRESFVKVFIEAYNVGNSIEWINLEYKEYRGINTSLTEISSYGNNPKDYGKDLRLKVCSDNTIITHPIKDTFTREESLKKIFEFNKWRKESKDLGIDEAAKIVDWFNKNY